VFLRGTVEVMKMARTQRPAQEVSWTTSKIFSQTLQGRGEAKRPSRDFAGSEPEGRVSNLQCGEPQSRWRGIESSGSEWHLLPRAISQLCASWSLRLPRPWRGSTLRPPCYLASSPWPWSRLGEGYFL